MGPSGSGKTTLLNVISTLDAATGGIIEIAGIDITKMKQGELSDFRSQKLGFIFQDFNLLENLSIYENIALPLSLQGIASKKIGPKVEKVAGMLGITEILRKYPSEVSGGQKQRSAAARALVHEPAIILGTSRQERLIQKCNKSFRSNEKFKRKTRCFHYDGYS